VLQLDTQELAWRPLDRPKMSRVSGIIVRTGYSLAPTVVDFLDVFEATVRAQGQSGLFSSPT
jgi:hypothetical protein